MSRSALDVSEIEVFIFFAMLLEVFLEVFLLHDSTGSAGFQVIEPILALFHTVTGSVAKAFPLITAGAKILGKAAAARGIPGASSNSIAAVESLGASSSTIGPMARGGTTGELRNVCAAKITVLTKLFFFDTVATEILFVGSKSLTSQKEGA